ncbi:hypothetical protein BgiMline_004563 [Biomphalaria glabrata]|nr:hypothetical protein BgiMline_002669 [Biomphalaria glabrata]
MKSNKRTLTFDSALNSTSAIIMDCEENTPSQFPLFSCGRLNVATFRAHGLSVKSSNLLTSLFYKYLQHWYPRDSSEESEDVIESGLVDEYVECVKADKHSEFIDINEFCLNHLPEDIRHENVYKWLKIVEQSVVKLQNVVHHALATGRVSFLDEEEGASKVCPVKECRHRQKLGDHVVYGGLGIITNTHFVSRELDAEETQVEFFYSEENSTSRCTERGSSSRFRDTHFDYSVFSCYVHDKSLVKKMKGILRQKDQLWLQIPETIRLLTKKYAIVISHPHGTSKKISIGHVQGSELICTHEQEKLNAILLLKLYDACIMEKPGLLRFVEHNQTYDLKNLGLRRFEAYYKCLQSKGLTLPYKKIRYTAATCRGSSGAPVYMGNTVIENRIEFNLAHTHKGATRETNVNACYI